MALQTFLYKTDLSEAERIDSFPELDQVCKSNSLQKIQHNPHIKHILVSHAYALLKCKLTVTYENIFSRFC